MCSSFEIDLRYMHTHKISQGFYITNFNLLNFFTLMCRILKEVSWSHAIPCALFGTRFPAFRIPIFANIICRYSLLSEKKVCCFKNVLECICTALF